jgi:hypothetical protein
LCKKYLSKNTSVYAWSHTKNVLWILLYKITIIFSIILLQYTPFFYMTWQIDSFLLNDHIKLFYIISASSLNLWRKACILKRQRVSDCSRVNLISKVNLSTKKVLSKSWQFNWANLQQTITFGFYIFYERNYILTVEKLTREPIV